MNVEDGGAGVALVGLITVALVMVVCRVRSEALGVVDGRMGKGRGIVMIVLEDASLTRPYPADALKWMSSIKLMERYIIIIAAATAPASALFEPLLKDRITSFRDSASTKPPTYLGTGAESEDIIGWLSH